MLNKTLAELYDQYIDKLRSEVKSFPDDRSLWKTSGDIPNSAGNLTLHLIGNLNHFFGATISKNGFVRDRDSEFANDGVTKDQLLGEIDKVKKVVNDALRSVAENEMQKTYPVQFQDKDVSTEYVLVYLLGHLNYHLGQIDYHRRLLAGN
jgi:hypothetical protein